MSMRSFKTTEEYIANYPKNVQVILKRLRIIIKNAAPKAEEAISYGIPTFKLNGNLVHFGAFTKHVGFYPASSGIRVFKKELAAYKTTKGTLQLPFDKPLPAGLISKIVKFRVRENLQKKAAKSLGGARRV